MVTIDRNELKAPTWVYEIKQMTQNQIIFFQRQIVSSSSNSVIQMRSEN